MLLIRFAILALLLGGWVSPTGHNDPDAYWTGETDAYDGDEETYATHGAGTPAQEWTSFLELTHAALSCDKVRFMCDGASMTTIDIDLWYNDDWQHLYQGAYTLDEWVEKSIGSTETVTAMRIALFNDHASATKYPRIYEAEFNEVTAGSEVGQFIMINQ